jgi:hypothetical protein
VAAAASKEKEKKRGETQGTSSECSEDSVISYDFFFFRMSHERLGQEKKTFCVGCFAERGVCFFCFHLKKNVYFVFFLRGTTNRVFFCSNVGQRGVVCLIFVCCVCLRCAILFSLLFACLCFFLLTIVRV